MIVQLDRETDLAIVGIGFMDDPANLAEYLVELGDPYDLVFLDTQRRATDIFGAIGPPYTMAFDESGRLTTVHPGPIDEDFVEWFASVEANRASHLF